MTRWVKEKPSRLFFLAALKTLPEEEPPSDTALMQQLIGRESAALERLYDRYSRAVYSLVLRILEQAATAEEVVQDVFFQLWRNAHLYESSRGPLEPWLFTLARNRALDCKRLKRERQRRREDTFEAQPLACAAPDPEHMVDSQRLAERVRASMRALPERQRKAIELAFFEGLTHSEIARALSEPLGTVKGWIRTGLLRLRQSLEEAS
jgi:RNA polymerase sigma-70 factor, ECF subfamily